MAPVALASLAKSTLDNTIGSIYLGVVGSALLSGITILQVYTYYHRYPKDSLLNKIVVGVLGVFDFFHLALIIHGAYYYVVTGYGKPEAIQSIPWTIKLSVVFNVIIILIVHSLYAQRVWLLGGYHQGVLKYVVAAVVAGGFVIGMVLSVLVFSVHTYTQLDRVSWVVYTSIGTATSIDFVIALVMCYYLRKSKGGMVKLNTKISRIMQYTVSSGLLTSAFSLTSLFTYILLPNTFIFLALTFLVTKSYAGSFLALLNSRQRRTLTNSPPVLDSDTTPSVTWAHSEKHSCISDVSPQSSPMPPPPGKGCGAPSR